MSIIFTQHELSDVRLALVRAKEYIESNRAALHKDKYLTPSLDDKLVLLYNAINIVEKRNGLS